jgi:hypothetical protein
MSVIIDGTSGITTPSETNTGTLSVTGVTTLTGGLNAALPVLSGGTGVTTKTGTGAVVLGTSPSISGAVMTTMASSVITSGTAVSTATCSFTGVISGTALTASAITGTIAIGQLITGTGVTAGTTIISGSGTAWVVSVSQTVASTAITVVGIDFTSIPSWVKRITVMFNGISVTTGGVAGSSIIVQIGYSGGLLTTSTYLGATTALGAAATTTAYSNGFMIETAPVAARAYQGVMTLVNITGNGWCELHTLGNSDIARCNTGGGFATLAGVLDRIRITTQSGTDTFDAGSVNILYE